jgi:hypothetical protein
MATLLQFIKFLSKMHHCFFPNISLPSSNVTKLIEDFYTSEDKKVESLSTPTRSLIIDTSYFNKEFKDTAVITFKNRPSKQQEIYLEISSNKKFRDSFESHYKALYSFG